MKLLTKPVNGLMPDFRLSSHTPAAAELLDDTVMRDGLADHSA